MISRRSVAAYTVTLSCDVIMWYRLAHDDYYICIILGTLIFYSSSFHYRDLVCLLNDRHWAWRNAGGTVNSQKAGERWRTRANCSRKIELLYIKSTISHLGPIVWKTFRARRRFFWSNCAGEFVLVCSVRSALKDNCSPTNKHDTWRVMGQWSESSLILFTYHMCAC